MDLEALAQSLRRHVGQISLNNTLVLGVLCLLLYPVLLAVYRISLHPLAKYPGPKLAGASYWYEYYYDVTKKGNYIFKIMDLHKQYGEFVIPVGAPNTHL